MPKRKKTSIGERTSQKIAARGDLRSESMPHGEIYRGPLADRALRAVGARAMTVEGDIIVNHSFDSGRAEDQALYAHEMYHQEQSGGEAGASIRDAEEISARAVESMVYHRAKSGKADPIPKSPTELLNEEGGQQGKQGRDFGSSSEGGESGEPDPVQGYLALRDQGFSHEEIVQNLAVKVLDEMGESSDRRSNRSGDLKGLWS
jgi:hypothetical protein